MFMLVMFTANNLIKHDNDVDDYLTFNLKISNSFVAAERFCV